MRAMSEENVGLARRVYESITATRRLDPPLSGLGSRRHDQAGQSGHLPKPA